MPCPFATTVFLLYGGLGDAIALTSTAPLERLILILQTSSDDDNNNMNAADVYFDIVKSPQGYKSLWIGNSYRIVHSIITRSLNEYFQKAYENLLISKEDSS